MLLAQLKPKTLESTPPQVGSTLLKSTVEVASAIAIIVTLALVGWEVRQNTQTLKIAAYQELTSQIIEFNRVGIDHPEIGDFERSFERGDPLTESQFEVLNNRYFEAFRLGDLVYYQFLQGALPEGRLDTALGPLRAMIRRPFFGVWWELRRDGFTADYRAFVDSLYSAEQAP